MTARIRVPRSAGAFLGLPPNLQPARVVIGSVRPGRVRLTALVPGFGNSWRPIFRGRLQPTDHGSELVGTVGLFPGVRAFSLSWFGGIVAFACAFVAIALVLAMEQRWHEAGKAALMLLVAAGLFAFGATLTHGMTRLGARDECWLRQWLADRLAR